MKRTYIPTAGMIDWRSRLADPEKHWVRGKSAFELAVSWEIAAKTDRGLPLKVADLLEQQPLLQNVTCLFALPEHQVAVPGNGRASQTDLWALLRCGDDRLISLAVEGKAGEPFGDSLGKWLGSNDNQNRIDRRDGLFRILDVAGSLPDETAYQLLHRTASAVIEAERCGASIAVVAVQHFGENAPHFADFHHFAGLLGADVTQGSLTPARPVRGVSLYLGWVDCPFATDAEVVAAGG